MNSLMMAGAAFAAFAGGASAQPPAPAAQGAPQSVTRDQALARADAMFARLDANRDGQLTRDEVRQSRQAQRAQRQSARFDRLDANRDGSLSREEFSHRGTRAERGEHDGRRFMRGGRGGRGQAMRGGGRMGGGMLGADGVITREEFRQQAAERFDRRDVNNDGTISADERGRRGGQGRRAGPGN